MSTVRASVVVAATLLWFSGLGAQDATVKPQELTVKPAAEPVLALRYRFYRPLRELNKNNPSLYFKQLVESYQKLDHQDFHLFLNCWDRRDTETRERHRAFVAQHAELLRLMHELAMSSFGERMFKIDSTSPERFVADPIECKVAEDLIYLVRLKLLCCNTESESISVVCDALRLAEFVSSGPTVTYYVSSAAMYQSTMKGIQDLLQRYPKTNFYWALSTIPRPLLRGSLPLNGELGQGIDTIKELQPAHLATEGKDNEYWVQQYRFMQIAILDLLKQLDTQEPHAEALTVKPLFYPDSMRQFLLSHGYSNDRLSQLPETQMVMLAIRMHYESAKQDLEKYSLLPYPQLLKDRHSYERFVNLRMNQLKQDCPPAYLLLGCFFYTIVEIQRNCLVPDATLQRLLTLEGIRMHAAKHGDLPHSLSDVKIVPLFDNPWSGRPFEYSLESRMGNLQVFELAAPDGLNDAKKSLAPLRVTINFAD